MVESVLALALFAFAAFVIGQICYNCIYPLDMQDKNPVSDITIEQGIQAILDVTDYNALDSGTEVKTLDGGTCRVYGEQIPTSIIDLFELKIRIEGERIETYTDSVFVIRPSWYENTNDRETLVDDRTDLLEDKRRDDFEKMREEGDDDEGKIKSKK